MELTRYSVHRMVLWITGAGVGRWGRYDMELTRYSVHGCIVNGGGGGGQAIYGIDQHNCYSVHGMVL